jgi:hypothetical protein
MRVLHIVPGIDAGASARLHAEHSRALESYTLALGQFQKSQHELRVVYVTDPSWPKPSVSELEVFTNPVDTVSVGPNMGIRPRLGSFLPIELLQETDLVILANSDICVTPNFYHEVLQQVDSGHLAGSINRKSILGIDPDEIGALNAALNSSNWYLHPGSDCFFFPSASGEILSRSKLFMGAPPVGRHVVVTLSALNPSFKVFPELGVTFHFGDDRFWAGSVPLMRLKDLNFVYWFLELIRILPIVGVKNLLRAIRTPLDGPVRLPILVLRFIRSSLGLLWHRKQDSRPKR